MYYQFRCNLYYYLNKREREKKTTQSPSRTKLREWECESRISMAQNFSNTGFGKACRSLKDQSQDWYWRGTPNWERQGAIVILVLCYLLLFVLWVIFFREAVIPFYVWCAFVAKSWSRFFDYGKTKLIENFVYDWLKNLLRRNKTLNARWDLMSNLIYICEPVSNYA